MPARELAQPLGGQESGTWTFKTTFPERQEFRLERDGIAYIVIQDVFREATVNERMGIDARKKAAFILNVEPGDLELVKCPI